MQHLSPLLSLATFTALWLTILEFMDKYMHVDQSDLLVCDKKISLLIIPIFFKILWYILAGASKPWILYPEES